METLQRTANRGSISTGYDVSNSLKFEDATNERLRRDNPNSGQRRTYTVAMWLKRTELGYNRIWGVGISGNDIQAPYFKDTDEIIWYDYGGGGYRFNYHTNRKFRDTSAWYHLVFAVDTEQSTQADRVKLYVNGVEETSFSTQTEPSQNADTNWNYQGTWDVGTAIGEDPHFSGYMSEVYFIDDQQLDCTNFGEFDDDTGIWKPKEFSGTFGSNDVYANFDDASSLGADSSGNSNDWTTVNITSADQAQDSPTNSFATINTLQGNNSKLTITNGATSIVKSGNYGWQTTNANIAVSVGKWYAEFKLDTNCTLVMLGVNQADNEVAWYGSHIGAYSNSTAQGMGYYSSNGYFYRNGGSGAIGSTYTAGDIIGIAFCYNSDGTAFMGMSKNGTWQNSQDPSSGTTGMLGLNYGNAFTNNEMFTFAISTHESAGGILANFGGFDGFTVSSGNSDANGYGNFEYAVPTGYYALCTKNLAEYG